MKFIYRHITRSPIKSALVAGLTMLFVFAVGYLQFMIESREADIEHIYDTTMLLGHVFPTVATVEAGPRPLQNFIPGFVVNAALETGLIDEVYLEGGHSVAVITHEMPIEELLEGLPELNPGYEFFYLLWLSSQMLFDFLVGINELEHFTNDPQGFLSRTVVDIFSPVTNMNVEFAPGFGYDDFVDNEGAIPLVLSAFTMERRELALGDEVQITYYNPHDGLEWQTAMGVIIGVHGGEGHEIYNVSHATLLPLASLNRLLGDAIGHMTFRFGLTPQYNRQREDMERELLNAVLISNFNAPRYKGNALWNFNMGMQVYYEDMNLAIMSIESNLLLLNMLFPVTVVLSAAMGAGLSLLIMIQSAKNAAIMRVLGQGRGKTALLLWVEKMMICICGVALSIVAIFIVRAGFALQVYVAALPYLAGFAFGSVIGAFMTTRPSPLELLQVRE